MKNDPDFDVLVIGSGAAGLSLALRLAEQDIAVGVLSKAELREGSTYYAQGGISAVLGEDDSIESHVQDTLDAGAGLCDEDIVRYTVENGPRCIQWLIDRGVPFTRIDDTDSNSDYHLTREGGHSHRRVIHAADATGHAVETTLESLARNAGNLALLEHHVAVDLILDDGSDQRRCVGAYVLDIRNRHVRSLSARTVVLATGGANMVYLYSSNPHGASGDGIAIAWRAGCRVANMEFMQFHPTCLYHHNAPSFLISEALRGEGAVLRLPDGTEFMSKFDERRELAPRDIVARAIDHEMKRLGLDHVCLDISQQPAEQVTRLFPAIHARCLALGLDMTREPLPVVPAAHYTCGGIMTDRHGRTDIDNLYAIGETAFTGLHGANRMASNSLLECLVFAASAATDIADRLPTLPPPPALPHWDESQVTDSDEEIVVSHNWHELRRFMWDYVGIVRSSKRLQRAMHRIEVLTSEIHEYYGNFRITPDLVELRNLVAVAELIVASAMTRNESRGLHYTIDYPVTAKQARNTILTPGPAPIAQQASSLTRS